MPPPPGRDGLGRRFLSCQNRLVVQQRSRSRQGRFQNIENGAIVGKAHEMSVVGRPEAVRQHPNVERAPQSGQPLDTLQSEEDLTAGRPHGDPPRQGLDHMHSEAVAADPDAPDPAESTIASGVRRTDDFEGRCCSPALARPQGDRG